MDNNNSDNSITTPPSCVIMAKRPVPGQVKTRLIGDFSAYQAAVIHADLLHCTLQRLAAIPYEQLFLALDSQNEDSLTQDDPALSLDIPDNTIVIDQGSGTLGDRLDYVWQKIGLGPVVFFGVDCPDLPTTHLVSIPTALRSAGAACGPVEDGGYWCLAAQRYAPELLADIDWGTSAVYHQTRDAAQKAGLTFQELPTWQDVDNTKDLQQLRQRLQSATEPALTRLAQRLEMITQDTHP